MALEQTPTAVRVIDTAVGRAKNGPSSFYSRQQDHGVDHPQAPKAEMSVLGNSPNREMFPLFPDRIAWLGSHGLRAFMRASKIAIIQAYAGAAV
jgi:hypothetical protein